jgi:Protein kinase domain/Fibronectin type III domain
MQELQAGDPPRLGPYLLLGRLGAGGMGEVFLGRSPGGRLVAVKVIRPELAGDPGFRARFDREVAAARRVSGVFTTPVVDADLASAVPWLATGYVNGPSLAQAVDMCGPLPVASVLALAAGLAEGLGAVHAVGVIHRDLKPSNVLLAQDGPRLIDFGISSAVDATHLTRTGTVIGSPAFMSPEQVVGGAVGPASDVFSLGAVLVFAAAGEGPFGSGAPTAQLYRVVHAAPHLDQVPAPVRSLAERCLAKDPAQRPTAGQFLGELAAAYPSAADLTDWLPASVLSLVTLPRPAAAGHAAGPTVAPSAPPEMPTGAPAAPEPSVAAPGPPAQDALWPATMTSAAAGPQAAGADRPEPAAKVTGDSATLPVSAAAGPASTGPSWPAGQPGGAAGTAAGNRRRRRRVVSVIAAVAVLGGVGLVVAAPWKSPPVLRPAGLTADSATTSSVAFRWSGPATGPVPDRYEILQDGQEVGSVPGNITYYRVSGLAPDTSYQFRLIAVRNDKPSPQSAVLSITTVTPPVSAAVLDGYFTANYQTTSISTHEGWNIAKIGATWNDQWGFVPSCPADTCAVTLSGTFYGNAFTASLVRAGSGYAGTAPLDDYNWCLHPTNYVHDTLSFQIEVHGAQVQDTTWTASSWAGTVTLHSPYDPNGSCYAVTLKANVTSSS